MRRVKVRVYRRNPSRKMRKASHKRAKHRKHTHYGKVRAHSRRVNPARRVKHRKTRARRSMARRHNPVNVKGLFALTLRSVFIGGGFIAGKQVIGLISNGKLLGRQVFTPPAFIAQARPVFGVLSIFVGALVMKKAKSDKVKDVGLGMLAAGGVDIVTTLADKVSPGLLSAYINTSAPAPGLTRNLGAYVNRDTSGALRQLSGIPIPTMAGAFSSQGGSFEHGGGSFG